MLVEEMKCEFRDKIKVLSYSFAIQFFIKQVKELPSFSQLDNSPLNTTFKIKREYIKWTLKYGVPT